jgi:CxxC motif-containing protein (DUF1111 family)
VKRGLLATTATLLSLICVTSARQTHATLARSRIGSEIAVHAHLRDGDEFRGALSALLSHGEQLFRANWTIQDGAGRPSTKGTGRPLAQLSNRLVGPRAFNRVSAPDANSCAGCHNAPYGIIGGGGDFVTSVFVLGQRFDFSTFDPHDSVPTAATMEESGEPATLQDSANLRATTGMFGAGYLEMLARQMTEQLQRTRDSIHLGETKALVATGVHFGSLTLTKAGLWDTSKVEGLSRLSLLATDRTNPPSMVIRPWHQSSNVVSLREFTNTAFNQHHGIQSTERFGVGTDPDGDGVKNELTRADVTAVTVWQATLQAPGRVIPHNGQIEQAVLRGERTFETIGCATCHIPKLPLEKGGSIFIEPNPFNPPGNLRTGETESLKIDLSSELLPAPRLKPDAAGVVWVDAYTDLKLHDICGPGDGEPIDQNQSQWSRKLLDGNCRFLTKRLWGTANEPPFFHHGLFTSLRQSVIAHGGEALHSRQQFQALAKTEQDALIEFLKTLQVLPPGTRDRMVDEKFCPRPWPPTADSGASPAKGAVERPGSESAVSSHLRDDQSFSLSITTLIEYGKRLFSANWTDQDGVGRPVLKGNGAPLTDPKQLLTGRRAFNRISGPDANSCLGCHNAPYGAGGAGDIVTASFEGAGRFDFVTFDRRDRLATRGSLDEAHRPVNLQTVGNERATPELLGAGFIEMLARQMTRDLQSERDSLQPGHDVVLSSKGVSFGRLIRRSDGSWDTRQVEGLSPQSLAVTGKSAKPTLLVRPWHQSGTSTSLREVTNASFNEHHGLQSTERFGANIDADQDRISNELTRADITAVAVFEATLPVPGRVIPNDPEIEQAVITGERLFAQMRCTVCHVSSLPLDRAGWIYDEPGPYNGRGNAMRADTRPVIVDLSDLKLPQPRLIPAHSTRSVLDVPAYTDLKLHDITDSADPAAQEPLDLNQKSGSKAYVRGNRRFLTRRLWAVGSSPTHFHNGLLTTIREAVLAHAGEALESRRNFERLDPYDQGAVIEFLKSMRALPPGTTARIVDEHFQPRAWPQDVALGR